MRLEQKKGCVCSLYTMPDRQRTKWHGDGFTLGDFLCDRQYQLLEFEGFRKAIKTVEQL